MSRINHIPSNIGLRRKKKGSCSCGSSGRANSFLKSTDECVTTVDNCSNGYSAYCENPRGKSNDIYIPYNINNLDKCNCTCVEEISLEPVEPIEPVYCDCDKYDIRYCYDVLYSSDTALDLESIRTDDRWLYYTHLSNIKDYKGYSQYDKSCCKICSDYEDIGDGCFCNGFNIESRFNTDIINDGVPYDDMLWVCSCNSQLQFINREECKNYCTKKTIRGCTNRKSRNFNPSATIDDGSCIMTLTDCPVNDECSSLNTPNVPVIGRGCYTYMNGLCYELCPAMAPMKQEIDWWADMWSVNWADYWVCGCSGFDCFTCGCSAAMTPGGDWSNTTCKYVVENIGQTFTPGQGLVTEHHVYSYIKDLSGNIIGQTPVVSPSGQPYCCKYNLNGAGSPDEHHIIGSCNCAVNPECDSIVQSDCDGDGALDVNCLLGCNSCEYDQDIGELMTAPGTIGSFCGCIDGSDVCLDYDTQCIYTTGCTNESAVNYDPDATIPDSPDSCIYPGCIHYCNNSEEPYFNCQDTYSNHYQYWDGDDVVGPSGNDWPEGIPCPCPVVDSCGEWGCKSSELVDLGYNVNIDGAVGGGDCNPSSTSGAHAGYANVHNPEACDPEIWKHRWFIDSELDGVGCCDIPAGPTIGVTHFCPPNLLGLGYTSEYLTNHIEGECGESGGECSCPFPLNQCGVCSENTGDCVGCMDENACNYNKRDWVGDDNTLLYMTPCSDGVCTTPCDECCVYVGEYRPDTGVAMTCTCDDSAWNIWDNGVAGYAVDSDGDGQASGEIIFLCPPGEGTTPPTLCDCGGGDCGAGVSGCTGLDISECSLQAYCLNSPHGQNVTECTYTNPVTNPEPDVWICNDDPHPNCFENFYDECGICGGSGIPDGSCDCNPGTLVDCAGECGGTAIEDECGVCDGSGIPIGDCDCNGTTDYGAGCPCGEYNCGCGCGETDECINSTTCEDDDGNGICNCNQDCNSGDVDCLGVCDGGAVDDTCGVCDGGNVDDLGCGCFEAGPSGCDNTCNSTAVVDCAGVCGGTNEWSGTGCGCIGPDMDHGLGDNWWCWDCAGVPYGDADEDDCGICNGTAEIGVDGLCTCDNGDAVYDDCAGVCGGSNALDACNQCVIDGSGSTSNYKDDCGDCHDDLCTGHSECDDWNATCAGCNDINADNYTGSVQNCSFLQCGTQYCCCEYTGCDDNTTIYGGTGGCPNQYGDYTINVPLFYGACNSGKIISASSGEELDLPLNGEITTECSDCCVEPLCWYYDGDCDGEGCTSISTANNPRVACENPSNSTCTDGDFEWVNTPGESNLLNCDCSGNMWDDCGNCIHAELDLENMNITGCLESQWGEMRLCLDPIADNYCYAGPGTSCVASNSTIQDGILPNGLCWMDCQGICWSTLEEAENAAMNDPDGSGSCCMWKGSCLNRCDSGIQMNTTDECHCDIDMDVETRCDDFDLCMGCNDPIAEGYNFQSPGSDYTNCTLSDHYIENSCTTISECLDMSCQECGYDTPTMILDDTINVRVEATGGGYHVDKTEIKLESLTGGSFLQSTGWIADFAPTHLGNGVYVTERLFKLSDRGFVNEHDILYKDWYSLFYFQNLSCISWLSFPSEYYQFDPNASEEYTTDFRIHVKSYSGCRNQPCDESHLVLDYIQGDEFSDLSGIYHNEANIAQSEKGFRIPVIQPQNPVASLGPNQYHLVNNPLLISAESSFDPNVGSCDMELASGNLSYEWQFNVNNSGWIPLDNINSTILFEPDIYNWLLEEYLAGLENIVKIKVKVINMFSEYDIDIKTIYVVKEIPISSKTTGFPNFRDSKGRRHYSTMSEGIVNEIYSDEENSMDRRSTSSISTSGNNRLSSKHFSGVTRLNQNLPSFTKTSNKDTLKERMEMRLNKGKNL